MADVPNAGASAKAITGRELNKKLDLLLDAANHLEEVQQEQGEILFHLEQRPIADLAGIERELRWMADAIHRIVTPYIERPVRLRPWWLTPGLLTVAVLVGFVVGLAWVSWVQTHRWPLAWPGAVQQSVPVKKGR